MEKHRLGSAGTALVSRCTATGCCQHGTREPKPLTTTRAGQKGPGDRGDRRRGLWCCSSRGRDERGAWPEHGEPRHHPTPPDKPSRGIKSILCSRSRDFRASPVAIETRLPELLLIVIPAVPSFLPALPSSHALAPGAGSPPAPRPPPAAPTWAMWHLSSARSISQAALALVNCCCSSPAPRRSSRSSVHSSFRVTFMSASVLMHSLGCRGPGGERGLPPPRPGPARCQPRGEGRGVPPGFGITPPPDSDARWGPILPTPLTVLGVQASPAQVLLSACCCGASSSSSSSRYSSFMLFTCRGRHRQLAEGPMDPVRITQHPDGCPLSLSVPPPVSTVPPGSHRPRCALSCPGASA